MMKKLLTAIVPLLLAGCMNIDYVGRKFTEQEYVKVVRSVNDVPLDDYTLIGKVTVAPSYKAHPYAVEDAVAEAAREFGGDILAPAGMKSHQRNVYADNSEEFGAPDIAERKISDEEKKRFGKTVPLRSPASGRLKRIYYFNLYKKSSEVKRQLGY